VDHPCYRCNSAVEDGIPFCPHCNAPQIRVASAAISELPLEPEVPAPLYARDSAAPPLQKGFQWSRAIRSAALAAGVAGVLVIIPLKSGGLGMLAAGFLSTFFYRIRNRLADLTPAVGARLGALSGALGFLFLMLILAMVVATQGEKFHQMAVQYIQQYFSGNTDPEMQKVLDLYKTPRTFWWMMALGSAMSLIVSLILAAIGGALGAALLRVKERL
jgi:hypothetical protein